MPQTPTLAEVLAAGNDFGETQGVTIGSNVEIFANTSPGSEVLNLRVGQNYLTLGVDGSFHLGAGNATLEGGADGSIILVGASGGLEISPSGNVILTGLPTSDPAVAGALYSDGGTVKVSAG